MRGRKLALIPVTLIQVSRNSSLSSSTSRLLSDAALAVALTVGLVMGLAAAFLVGLALITLLEAMVKMDG